MKIIKKYNIDIFVLIILLTSLASLLVLVKSGDELWNFANCYKISIGYKIYRDINVIVTPLFFYVAQLFFAIFGKTILAFRIYNIIIFTVLFGLIYKIFESLNIIRQRRIVYTVIIIILFNGIVYGGANYNILVMIPILIDILLILKNKDNNLINGLLIYITFLIKQNVCFYYAIGLFVYKILNEKDLKRALVDVIKTYVVTTCGIIAFMFYLYLDNNLYNFINYCFLGIKEFGQKNMVFDFYNMKYSYISVTVLIFNIIILKNKEVQIDVRQNTKKLLCFGIPLMLVQFPIFNYYHTTLSGLIILISFIYTIEEIIIKNLDINKKKEKAVYIIIILIYILYYIYIIFNAIILLDKNDILIKTQGTYTRSIN